MNNNNIQTKIIKISGIAYKLTPEERNRILELGYSNYFYNIIEHFISAFKHNKSKDSLFKDAYEYCNVDSDVEWHKDKSYKSDFVKTYSLINRLSKKLSFEELQTLEDYMIKDTKGEIMPLHEAMCR